MINLPEAQVGRNRIKHDTELSIYNYQSRLNNGKYKQEAYPETIRISGGKSSLDLSFQWQRFLENINTVKAYKFMQVSESGWHNKGKWPRVEQLTFGGNFVEVTRIDGDRCYIKHYSNDQLPPIPIGDFYDDTLIQLFGVTRKNNTVESPPCGLCRTLIISRNSGEELWISKDYLTFVSIIPPKSDFPKIITVNFGMNLREFHSVEAKITGRIPLGMKTQIEEVVKDGINYWGRVSNSWLCLKLNGQYFTNWGE